MSKFEGGKVADRENDVKVMYVSFLMYVQSFTSANVTTFI